MISGPIEIKDTSFSYDSGNRLVQLGSTNYEYDADDHRISETTDGVTTEYVYDDESNDLSQLLVKTDSDGNSDFYVYGLNLIGEETTDGTYNIYHFDYRGSTTAITDQQGGITDTFEYDSYGKLLNHNGSSQTAFLYNGRDGVISDKTGLYYMRARYYSPELMRFINADTVKGEITNSITLNRYAYANGNPVLNVDPEGEFITVAIGAAIGGIVGGSANLINQVATEGWSDVSWGEVAINTGSGALSGAVAGTGVGLAGAIVANEAISVANYAATQHVNNDSLSWQGLGTTLVWGGFGAAKGGSGILHGETGRIIRNWQGTALKAKLINVQSVEIYAKLSIKNKLIQEGKLATRNTIEGTALNSIGTYATNKAFEYSTSGTAK
nr:RHS repeat-associated core domain-containing protein [Paraliobacillus zengyii]